MNRPVKSSDAAQPTCISCDGGERRAFIQSAVGAVIAIVGLSFADASDAVAQISALATREDGRADVKYTVPAADGVSIDTKNDVIIARSAGKVYAFALSCPHQNTELRWNAKDKRFQCPKHKSRYQASGEFIDGRATRNMDRLSIKLEGGTLTVDVDREIRSDEEAAKWAAAVVVLPV